MSERKDLLDKPTRSGIERLFREHLKIDRWDSPVLEEVRAKIEALEEELRADPRMIELKKQEMKIISKLRITSNRMIEKKDRVHRAFLAKGLTTGVLRMIVNFVQEYDTYKRLPKESDDGLQHAEPRSATIPSGGPEMATATTGNQEVDADRPTDVLPDIAGTGANRTE